MAESRRQLVLYITDQCTWMGVAPDHGTAGDAELRTLSIGRPAMPIDALDLDDFARSLAQGIRETVAGTIRCTAVLPSSWAFLQLVPDSAESRSDAALAYELEEFLPIEVESTTTAAVSIGAWHLAYTVLTHPIKHMVDVLGSHGIRVESLYVDLPLLAASPTGGSGTILADRERLAVMGTSDPEKTCLVNSAFHGGNPAASAFHAALAGAGVLQGKEPAELLVVAREPAGPLFPFQKAWGDAGKVLLGEGAVRRVVRLATEAPASSNLRRGPLAFQGRWSEAKRELASLCTAIVAVLIVVIARSEWQVGRLASAADSLTPALAKIYANAMPDAAAIPAAPALQLRSELTRLVGLTARHESIDGWDRSPLSTLDVLREVIDRIPSDIKLQLQGMDVHPSGCQLVGRTLSHDAAGRLVAAVNQDSRYLAEPPQTKLRDDRTVEFTIHVRHRHGEANGKRSPHTQ